MTIKYFTLNTASHSSTFPVLLMSNDEIEEMTTAISNATITVTEGVNTYKVLIDTSLNKAPLFDELDNICYFSKVNYPYLYYGMSTGGLAYKYLSFFNATNVSDILNDMTSGSYTNANYRTTYTCNGTMTGYMWAWARTDYHSLAISYDTDFAGGRVSFSAIGFSSSSYNQTADRYGELDLSIIIYNTDTLKWQSFNARARESLGLVVLGLYSGVTNTTLDKLLDAAYIDGETIDPEDLSNADPYKPGGKSGSGGGTGDFDGTSDTIAVPSLPSTEITDSGFLTLFVTSQTGLRNLANELWSNVFSAIMPGGSLETTVTALKNVVSSPYDAILGCSIVPVNVSTSGSKNVKMYGVIDCGVSMSVAASQYATVDCGTLNINEFWGAYLDYSPYTKVTSLYLPYVGVVSVDVDQIMGKALQVVYHIDILSGQCVAYIVIDGSVEFQYQGHCSTPIPITSVDYSSTIQAGLGLVGSVANIAGSAIAGAAGGAAGVIAAAGGALASAVPSMAGDVMNAKPDIKSGSGIGGMGGIMSVQKPFLIIERPRQSLPALQNSYTGYPSNIRATLKNLTGYTEVSRVFIKGMSATEEEQKEIESLLYKGVIL